MPQINDSVDPTQKITISSALRSIGNAIKNIFSVSTFFVAFKYIAFIGFTGISAILSVNMFMRLSGQPVEQFALVSVAVTLEFFKIFSIVRGNTLWRLKLKTQAARAYGMYTILAIVAIMASYGFTLTVINRNITINDSATITLQIANSEATQKQYAASLKTMDQSIKANQDRLAVLPPDFTSAAQSLNNTLAKLQASIADVQAQLSAEQTNEITLKNQALQATKLSTTTTSMFKLMAQGFKWLIPSIDENSLMLFLLLLISLIIELGIISTSPAIPIDQKHLKHFLDEMSAHKADELLLEAQGGKKKKEARRQTFAGRIAQWWMNSKRDVEDVTHPTPITPKIEMVSAPRQPKLVPSESAAIGSVPVRKPAPRFVINDVDNSAPLAETIPPQAIEAIQKDLEKRSEADGRQAVADLAAKAREAAPAVDATFSEPIIRPGVPLRTTPAAPAKVDAPSVAPQFVGEAKIYRFGKTTGAVKDMFVAFVSKLFDEDPSAPLRDVETAANQASVPVNLAKTFMKRLQEIKGARGVTLIEERDGKMFPNYPEGYIISYATAEPSRERSK
jgi:hypothetical protein